MKKLFLISQFFITSTSLFSMQSYKILRFLPKAQQFSRNLRSVQSIFQRDCSRYKGITYLPSLFPHMDPVNRKTYEKIYDFDYEEYLKIIKSNLDPDYKLKLYAQKSTYEYLTKELDSAKIIDEAQKLLEKYKIYQLDPEFRNELDYPELANSLIKNLEFYLNKFEEAVNDLFEKNFSYLFLLQSSSKHCANAKYDKKDAVVSAKIKVKETVIHIQFCIENINQLV